MQVVGHRGALDRVRLAMCIVFLLLGLATVHATIGVAAVGRENPGGSSYAPMTPPSLSRGSDAVPAAAQAKLAADLKAADRRPGHYIVVLESSVNRPSAVADEQIAQRDGELELVYGSAIKGYSAELSHGAVEAIRRDPRVKYVMPDGKVEGAAQSIPTGISRIFATENAALDIDGVDDVRVNVDVAIIDSGTDYTHPDLNVVSRTNCIPLNEEEDSKGCSPNPGGLSEAPHGTHTGGTVGAIDNGLGVVGVAPGARLWAVRVLGKENTGYWSWVIEGVDWVTEHASEIEVANMSVAGYGPVPALEEAISKSVEKGVVYAVAAGNEAINTATIAPASNPDVISVSGMADYDGKPGEKGSPTCIDRGPDDGKYRDSGWGSVVDITAPAVCINSTIPGGLYEEAWGTSMAAPHVAGAAAVLAGKSNPNTKKDVEAIRQSLIDSGTLAWNDTSEDTKVEPVLYLDDEPLTKTEVATGAWSNTDGTSATLYGAMNARGLETSYQFQYGPTTEYGQNAPASAKKVGAGTYYVTVSETVNSLKAGQTYHYRLVATNSSGTFYGKDRSFTASRWAVEAPAGKPTNPESHWLEDVSCPVAGSCFATGAYIEGGKDATAYRLVNGEWKFESLPVEAGGYGSQGLGMSCTSTTACTAAGDFTNKADNVAPLVARWNGSSWQAQTVPPPYAGAPYTRMLDVSCSSSTECMGVGIYQDNEGVFVNYAAKWKNGEWTTVLPPNPSGSSQSLLESVSCPAANSCKAVGWYNPTSGATTPVIASWDGSSWKLQSTARASGWLAGVSCTSGESCVAVGGSWGSEAPIEKWNGTAWSNPSAEQPNGGYLEDVSCASASHCTATGTTWLGAQRERRGTWAETWNGSSWKVQPTPREAEAIGELKGVSCIPLWGCGSVGYAQAKDRAPAIARRADLTTGDSTSITPAKATLNGAINPGGLSTAYQFEYGTTLSYGSKVPASSESAGSGGDSVDVSQEISELQHETVYHYRLVASNANGTEYGKDRTFRSGTPAHQFQSAFGTTGTGKLNYPMGTAVDGAGNVWVVDRDNSRVVKFNSKGEYLLHLGAAGAGNGQFKKPVDVAVTATGDVWVTDSENYRVQKFNSKGEYLSQKFGSNGVGNGQFLEPWGIAIDLSGNIWVSDHSHYRIQEFTAAGAFIRSVGVGSGSGALEFKWPSGLAVDQDGDIWVADMGNNRVQQFSATGKYLSQFGAEGSADGQLDEPLVLDVKASGDILVAERGTDRVQQFSSAGEYIGKFNLGGNPEPAGLAATPSGTVYVSYTRENKVEKWQQAIPEAVTLGALEVAQTGATLTGTVDPRGVATTYRFEYGKTSSYGTRVPLSNESAGSGSGATLKTQAVSSLQESTTYHFRLVATNANGTTYGKDEAFTTKASISSRLSSMAVTEAFNGSSGSLANFSANFAALGWAAGSPAKGEDTATGWRPVAAYPTVNGAYYNSTITDTGSGIATVSTMAVNPGNTSRYFSIWLDMSTPTTTRAGYELRFTNVGANSYDVTLSKWQSGSQTILASQSSYAFANGNSFAVVDQGSTVSAWTNTGSGFTQLLSASDSSFSSGKAAVEGSGNISRLTNLKVGTL
jgi:subtilisin family serine protease